MSAKRILQQPALVSNQPWVAGMIKRLDDFTGNAAKLAERDTLREAVQAGMVNSQQAAQQYRALVAPSKRT
jgi:hypothetical protein